MLLINYRTFFLFLFLLNFSCQQENSITPIEPVPTPRQEAWQALEYYGFIHFNMNTFTNKEWGYGDEQPSQFNPKALDTDQWARIIKEAGMKGIIITAKHHDGFCLWPSAFTEHSVKNSPWREGKGDLIKELAASCRKFGLKLGIYLSPWDRNHASYGTAEYITYFRNQLTELLTNYGPIFEVWFDGANGGDGYYGGANEERRVDKKSYYDWPTTHELVRKWQPQAVIFSDAGPDIRWVGNEKGYAAETTWSPIFRDSVYGGMPDFHRFSKGQENGTHWIPTETDVSIRPGWYYHPEEDNQVKSIEKLVDIYFNSVGLNSSLLLNIPVDDRGLIHENDEEKLLQLGAFIEEAFNQNVLKEGKVNSVLPQSSYDPLNLIDGDPETYWASNKNSKPAVITLSPQSPQKATIFEIREHLPFGQRVKAFQLELKTNGEWKTIKQGTTIGNKRLIRFDPIEVEALRFTIFESKASPVISVIGLYLEPKL